MSLFLLYSALLLQAITAQFPPVREGITTIKSVHHEGITISYKEPGICETTPGVKSYSGYVHLPPNSLDETGESQSYPINTFFWFFESRKDPHNAPLTIWLNGGPGGSSLLGLLSENGPCFVNDDSNSTRLNPWSWNNEVNMLYIDQPVQVGYSFDTLNNGTINLDEADEFDLDVDPIILRDFSEHDIPEQNNTFLVGTFASQNVTYTANTTRHGAVALWHFAQTWFEEFPVYKPHDEKVSLWTESYGGKYGPAFMDFFAHQNDKITNGVLSGPGVHYIHLDTLGIVNGCIDDHIQTSAYVAMQYNNTYSIRTTNTSFHEQQMSALYRPNGILSQISHCQSLARHLDPKNLGNNPIVNAACANISGVTNTSSAADLLIKPYLSSKKYGWFDITHPFADPFPTNFHLGYLNQNWVQRALGVPVNHTWAARPVAKAFEQTGDMARGGLLEDIADLLDNYHVKVSLVYGDRDFACNWLGGENASLALPYSQQSGFSEAGYSPLTMNDPMTPPFVSHGMTRQYGNLSFTRVYQAGHMVPSYQPEAAYKIFTRALFNKDIATGTIDLTARDEAFKTEGPRSTFHLKNEVLPVPKGMCYVFNVGMTCSAEEAEALHNGTAIVENWLVVGIGNSSTAAKTSVSYGGSRAVEQTIFSAKADL